MLISMLRVRLRSLRWVIRHECFELCRILRNLDFFYNGVGLTNSESVYTLWRVNECDGVVERENP